MLSGRSATRNALVALSLLAVAVRVCQAAARASIPYEFDYAEGTVLAIGQRVLNGQQIYPLPGPLPYILSPYGPVGYGLTAAALKVFGLSLVGPRFLVIASALLSAALIGGIAKELSAPRSIGVVFAAGFLCSPLVWIWLPSLRVDFPALLLSLSGLYVVARRGHIALASVLFVAAVLTRQTSIAAPIACGVELILQRRWRDVRAAVAWTCGLGLAATLAMGRNAFVHLVSTHSDMFDTLRYLSNLGAVLGGSFILVFAAAYGALFPGRVWTAGRLAWVYVGVCTLLTITAGKEGSETNHFIEWVAALSIAGAVCAAIGVASGDREAIVVLCGVVAVSVVAVAGSWWRPRHDVDPEGCRSAYQYIGQFPGDLVVSEDVAAIALSGKPVSVSDLFAYEHVEGVKWEGGGLEPLIGRGYFDLIVTGARSLDAGYRPSRWPPEAARAIQSRYRLARSFSCSPMLGSAWVRTEPQSP